MGLDMYLYKKAYVKNWDHEKGDDKFTVTVKKGGKKTALKPERVVYVTEQVMYWRKANAIHQWFVKNVQDGVDDCRTAHVATEQLAELLEVCKQVKADPSKAMELLPPQSGFFFGPTDVDDWYMENIDHTIAALEAELALPSVGRFEDEFEYHSSW
jgi:hypothetical protein